MDEGRAYGDGTLMSADGLSTYKVHPKTEIVNHELLARNPIPKCRAYGDGTLMSADGLSTYKVHPKPKP